MDHSDYFARFAQAAYQPDFAGIPSGYVRDDQFSDAETQTFYNPRNNHAVVAFRGTELKKGTMTAIKDLATDVALALGYQEMLPRFQKAERVTRAVHYKYQNVTVTGHSLGAALARHAHNKVPGINAVTFSEFAYPLDRPLAHYFKGNSFEIAAAKIGTELGYKFSQKVAGVIAGSRRSRGLVAYTHPEDPVALTTNLTQNTRLVRRSKNPHSLANYISGGLQR